MSRFLKFIGPMRTLTQRGTKFEKDKIYRVDDEERAFDMIETGRFQEVRDPTKKGKADDKAARRRGVNIRSARERQDDEDVNSERGDLSQADLHNRQEDDAEGDEDGEDGERQPLPDEKLTAIGEEGLNDPNRPKLPAQSFTSKNGAVKWAKDNLDIDLDKSRSLSELNRVIATEYGKKFAPPKTDDEDDDDTRDENTTVDPIVVA